jgi:hypothetical protein
MKKLPMNVTMTMSCISPVREKKELPVRIYVMVGQSNLQGHGEMGDEKEKSMP